MRIFILAASLVLSFVSLPMHGEASEFAVPKLSSPVVDQANFLTPQGQRAIEEIIRRANDFGKVQAQVLIVPTIGDQAIEQVTIQVFDKWKLGEQKKDNGVLFFLATKDRKMRIEVGRGLEGEIPDVIAKRILADQVAPMLRTGRTDEAIQRGVEAIIRRAQGEAEPAVESAEPQPSEKQKLPKSRLIFFGFIFILWIILGGFRRRGFGGGYYGGGGGGGWSGGGGGWSGGGGSSAGGGASSDW